MDGSSKPNSFMSWKGDGETGEPDESGMFSDLLVPVDHLYPNYS